MSVPLQQCSIITTAVFVVHTAVSHHPLLLCHQTRSRFNTHRGYSSTSCVCSPLACTKQTKGARKVKPVMSCLQLKAGAHTASKYYWS